MNCPTALAATEDRRRSTGESHQALHALLGDHDQPLTIPSARHAEQARLETSVFLNVCKLGGLARHPLGIVRLRPEEDQLILQLLDEPYIIRYWVDSLLPRTVADSGDPRDRVCGVAGLRYRREGSALVLYCPGTPARIALTGFNPRWWERIADLLKEDYQLLQEQPDWTPDERAAHTATVASAYEPEQLFSPLLRRIRATAGPGPINSTDAWRNGGAAFRLEVTDGPPCPDLVRLLGDGPTGLGWQVEHKMCTCRCDHIRGGCHIDFRDPATGLEVQYSNGKWGRTTDDRHALDELNETAFA
ncbi:hypothetical protein [Streptomyces chrestomyceticus]|uniref:Uncharacterized protein n=1 Tax=Streptomyces chrestomyceticus TaxID=68185 RepID=A0ABU7X766_9ACTN